ncbi:hypothetical protein PISMIDRAFT_18272 [Pisolithus microcarpus 441]|uniref:Uncharacterized protein n=1 Tax=Pisolithus microcarpus 441 TaxID=765257 RepID=A0A0C9YRY0_9AGAM|nr:hypothetical protein PISMIDRAFT_18272 [Pisolithus microcarpus 441]
MLAAVPQHNVSPLSDNVVVPVDHGTTRCRIQATEVQVSVGCMKLHATLAHVNCVFNHSVVSLEPWWNERLVKMPDIPSSLVLDVLARPFRRDPVDYACDEASERRETRLTRIE